VDRPGRIVAGVHYVKRATAQRDPTTIGKQLSAAPKNLETAPI
jgi:hypothetical protein